MASTKDRSRRLLQALKVLKASDAPAPEDDEAPDDPEAPPVEFEPGAPSVEVAGINAPGDSPVQRKLKKAKVRKSVDEEMEALWPK